VCTWCLLVSIYDVEYLSSFFFSTGDKGVVTSKGDLVIDGLGLIEGIVVLSSPFHYCFFSVTEKNAATQISLGRDVDLEKTVNALLFNIFT
jgi:hypothetical protein